MIKSIKLIILLVLPCILSANVYGQNPQLSQLYTNPLFLNPARAGYEQSINSANEGVNLRGAVRKQWPQLSSSFTTATVSVDGYDEGTGFGIGLAVLHDRQGDFITQEDIKGFFSSHIPLNKKGDIFHIGFDVSHHWMNYSTNGLLFMDQLTGGGINPTSIDPLSQSQYRTSYLNADTGCILELRPGEDNDNLFFVGISFHNLFKPNLALKNALTISNQVTTFIPILYGFELGYKKAFKLANKTTRADGNNRWSSLSANAYLKKQGPSMQLDIGLSYNFAKPVMIGIYYRGIPIRKYNDLIQQDALVGMFGFGFKFFTFTYSYDRNISTLNYSGGSHEVVISATFGSNLHLLQKRKQKRLVECPI